MITYEAVTPGEFKHGPIEIVFGVHDSPFGACVIGVTKRGICHLSFSDAQSIIKAREVIADMWPSATIVHDQETTAPYIKKIFSHGKGPRPLHLFVRGTNFQIKVWEALLAIPEGQTSTYAEIAKAVGSPKAVRAVGTACGRNHIAYLIPCHRVLTSSAGLGGYRWGIGRKKAMLALESSML